MKFFFDTSLSHRLASAIRLLREGNLPPESREEIVFHGDRFAGDTDDYDWLNTLAFEGGWVVLSADARIASNKFERKVWQDRDIVVCVLERGWKGLTLWDRAWRLVKYWPGIVEQMKKAKSGAAYKITQKGKLIRLP